MCIVHLAFNPSYFVKGQRAFSSVQRDFSIEGPSSCFNYGVLFEVFSQVRVLANKCLENEC